MRLLADCSSKGLGSTEFSFDQQITSVQFDSLVRDDLEEKQFKSMLHFPFTHLCATSPLVTCTSKMLLIFFQLSLIKNIGICEIIVNAQRELMYTGFLERM
jgi:hypothetical protein